MAEWSNDSNFQLALSPAASNAPGILVEHGTEESSARIASPLSTNRKGVSRRVISQRLGQPRSMVSLSAFSFIFSELVQHNQGRIKSVGDFESRLEEAGYSVGHRVIEYMGVYERIGKRETDIVNMLQFICNRVWKFLFNKVADGLERSYDSEDEYMIHDREPITNYFVSLPQDVGQLDCAAYLAGIIAGVLDASRFYARVTAHTVQPTAAEEGGNGGGDNEEHNVEAGQKTVFLVKFSPEVMLEEACRGNM